MIEIKLETLLDINKPLFIIHSMKEQLRLFWSQANLQQAVKFLDQWCFDALTSGIRQLIRVGMTLLKHRRGILNYFPHRITSGAVEGTVNKIKTLKDRRTDIEIWNISDSASITYTVKGTH